MGETTMQGRRLPRTADEILARIEEAKDRDVLGFEWRRAGLPRRSPHPGDAMIPDDQLTCHHEWVANSGRGGEPQYRPAQIVAGDRPVMHVACGLCGTRTWFTEAQWLRLPVAGETRQQRRHRERTANVAERREQERHARMVHARREAHQRTGQTYWNGEPARCRRVIVRVAPSPVATWWCADLAGTLRKAVEVTYHGHVFYLDDENGSGWAKVTVGAGSPGYGHSSLPDGCEVVSERGDAT